VREQIASSRLTKTAGSPRAGSLGLGIGLLALAMCAMACFAASAPAANRIYWANSNNKISFVALDATEAGDLTTTGATASSPMGVTIDSAAGRIYWANSNDTISFANLNGSGGADLITTGATVDEPIGVAVDPAAGRIYWANGAADKISFANLNGSGGDDLITTGATVDGPASVAVDPTAGRIYWTNANGNKISFANLNGSGGADLITTGATVSDPIGIAVDPAAGRIYWANSGGVNKVSFANLNGSGGADLITTGATVSNPTGVAINPAAGRIYWANTSGKISFANLNGTGGGDLPTLAATVSGPHFPALLEAPSPTGAPVVGGGAAVGSTLNCAGGSWAPDLLASFLYRAPQQLTYSWSLDGATIAGASSATQTATAPGAYRCTVTASNQAGSASQSSAPSTVLPPALGFGASPLVTLKLGATRIAAGGPLKVVVANGNSFSVGVRLSVQTAKKVGSPKPRLVKLSAKPVSVVARAQRTIKLKLPKVLRDLLERKGAISLRLSAAVTDPSGGSRTVVKRVTPKLKLP